MRFIAIILIALALQTPAWAQNLPNHVDPNTRDTVPDLSSLPAIRFLTTSDFPPFNYRDGGGTLVGYNIDLARAICAELKVACTIQAWPWEQLSDALSSNQGDAVLAGLAITAENAEKFDFSSIYLMLPGRFVTRFADVEGFSLRALAGKTLAVRSGSSHAQFVQRYLPQTRTLPFASEAEALDAVREREADAYFGDGLRAAFWLNETPDCCAFAGEPYFRPDLFGEGLAAAIPAGRETVRQAIDYALVRLKQDGKLDELYLRWFPVGFY